VKFDGDNVGDELSGNSYGIGKNEDTGGKSNKNGTSGGGSTNKIGLTVGDPRIVKQSNATNLVKVFFTPIIFIQHKLNKLDRYKFAAI
jgi:hypothetical protein